MNNRYIISLLLILLAFNACNPSKNKDNKTLSVTVEPQKYFLETIVGNHYTVNCLVPPGMNPENADFTPTQMMNLDKSDAFFKIGYLGIETSILDKLSKERQLKVVDCSKGIEAIGEPHHHDHNDGIEATHHHGHDAGDPHIWSSITSAKKIAENMYNALIELDETNKADYKINYEKLLNEINHTDSVIKSYLEKAPSKSFIIYHPALSYFAQEYGLTQYSIEHEGKNPSPSQLKELIDRAKAEGVKTIFIQQEFDSKNAETIAKEIGGKTISLNLMSYDWNEEMIKVAKALAQE